MIEIVRKVPKQEIKEEIKEKEKKEEMKESEKIDNEFEPLVDSDLLREMLKAIISNPENLKIEEQIGSSNLTILKVNMDNRDVPKVIGKQGKTIKTIQQFFDIVGNFEDRKIIIKLGSKEEFSSTGNRQIHKKRDRNYQIKQL
jgi:predicted RNA-binding protein YlqC (UPF0109 family)